MKIIKIQERNNDKFLTLPRSMHDMFKNASHVEVTIKGNGTDNINGSNTYDLTSIYDSVTVINNGSRWRIY